MSNAIPSNSFPPLIYQPGTAGATGSAAPEGFGEALRNAIDQVEHLHSDSQQDTMQLLQGDRTDVHNVMIAIEKADVAFQLMMQVRNKIVNAYQQVSQMQF